MSENFSDEHQIRPPRGKLSSTPSWVMLGFVLGALFVWLLPSRESPRRQDKPEAAQPPSAPAKAKSAPKPSAPPKQARLTDVEAVFFAYGDFAVWDANKTEIAVWNAERKSYADFYEVLRHEGDLYFRSIPQLTRPVLTHGTKTDLPLLYTETQEMRERWLETRRQLVPGVRAQPPVQEPPKVELEKEGGEK